MATAEKFIGRIPVRNIWVLMAYASDLGKLGAKANARFDENPDEIVDIIVELLNSSIQKRLKESLTPGFKQRRAVLRRVRGKINALETESHQLLSSGQVSCTFHELTEDTDVNRLLLCALELGARIAGDREVARRAVSLCHLLKARGISPLPERLIVGKRRGGGLSPQRKDLQSIAAADLILQMALPSEDLGNHPFESPEKEEWWVRRLFEKAMAGFLSRALDPKEYRVTTGNRLQWPIGDASEGLAAILPSMQTDITIDRIAPPHRLVIDTKFNEITTPGWHRKESLRSGYLYQLYTYLRSQEERSPGNSANSSGLLLHPAVGVNVCEYAGIQGHQVSFATVDLTRPATEISKSLKELIGTLDR